MFLDKAFLRGGPRITFFLVFAFSAPAQVAPAPPAEWRQWRGPDRNGVSRETGLLKKWPEAGPRLLWDARGVGDGFSSVSVSNGRVFTQGNREERSLVVALDLETGKEIWSFETGAAYKNGYGDGPRGTPT